MDLKTTKTLGGLGGLFIVLSFIPYLGALLSIVGLILLAIALKQISDRFPGRDIFSNFIKGIIVGFVGGIILIVGIVSAFGSDSSMLGIFALILGYVALITSAYFYKLSFSSVAEVLNQNLFKTAGNVIFWGSVAMIILIGGIVVWIGWILVTVAFFTLPDRIPQSTDLKETELQTQI